jgi:D-glycero-D-manno-heptose 1,7-bisphosphate phosphatase
MDSAHLPALAQISTVFLDRDGVINRKMPEGRYVASWEDFELLPGVPEAIARLTRAGKRVVVVSNQRGVFLGLYTEDDVRSIHARLSEIVQAAGGRIDGFYFCPHDRKGCRCRKPGPGLFEQAQKDFPEIEAAKSLMVGDSHSDIEFAHHLGMPVLFLKGHEAERRKPGWEKCEQEAEAVFSSLPEAVEQLLAAPCHDRKEKSLQPGANQAEGQELKADG